MEMHRRRFLKGALVGSTFASPMIAPFFSSAAAQAWPLRNITMVVPFPPGGQADLAARPVAQALEKLLGKSVVVDWSWRHGWKCLCGASGARRPHSADGAVVDDVFAGSRAALPSQALL